jgi:hypothetical protein
VDTAAAQLVYAETKAMEEQASSVPRDSLAASGAAAGPTESTLSEKHDEAATRHRSNIHMGHHNQKKREGGLDERPLHLEKLKLDYEAKLKTVKGKELELDKKLTEMDAVIERKVREALLVGRIDGRGPEDVGSSAANSRWVCLLPRQS